MIELKQETWDVFVARFGNRLGAGCSTEHALKMFIEDYWTELDRLAMEAGPKEDNEEVEELDIDDYFERKLKPIWDYVYNLQKQVNLLEQLKVYGPTPKWTPNNVPPVSQPVPVGFPYIIPDTHAPTWKITCTNANDNVPLSGIATTGYIKTVEEPKYTKEEIEEWSKIRFDDPSVRR
jgi:hypothetical protein